MSAAAVVAAARRCARTSRFTIGESETESFVARFSNFEPVEIGREVDSIAVWFQTHPRLRVSEPMSVTVGEALTVASRPGRQATARRRRRAASTFG
jgi:hypothetical protein